MLFTTRPLPRTCRRDVALRDDLTQPSPKYLGNDDINPQHPSDPTAVSSSRYVSDVSPEHADARQDVLRRVLRDAYQRLVVSVPTLTFDLVLTPPV